MVKIKNAAFIILNLVTILHFYWELLPDKPSEELVQFFLAVVLCSAIGFIKPIATIRLWRRLKTLWVSRI